MNNHFVEIVVREPQTRQYHQGEALKVFPLHPEQIPYTSIGALGKPQARLFPYTRVGGER